VMECKWNERSGVMLLVGVRFLVGCGLIFNSYNDYQIPLYNFSGIESYFVQAPPDIEELLPHYEPGETTLGILLMEARRLPGITKSIECALLNTHPKYALYIVRPNHSKDTGYAEWIESIPAVSIARGQRRNVQFIDMYDYCVGNTGNCAVLETRFWDQFNEDFLLVVQHDACLCGKKSLNFGIF